MARVVAQYCTCPEVPGNMYICKSTNHTYGSLRTRWEKQTYRLTKRESVGALTKGAIRRAARSLHTPEEPLFHCSSALDFRNLCLYISITSLRQNGTIHAKTSCLFRDRNPMNHHTRRRQQSGAVSLSKRSRVNTLLVPVSISQNHSNDNKERNSRNGNIKFHAAQ